MKKALVTLIVVCAIGVSAFAYYRYTRKTPPPTVATAAVTRGDLADRVGATGTLQAVTTVQVGTQVSGTILNMYADFNSLVKKGQVLARLDPSLFQTQIEQARANLIRAQADLDRLKVSLDDAQTKFKRAQELSAKQLIPASELDTAAVNVRSIDAQIRSSQAQVTQAQASLNQNQVNLDHTVIEAPIDGLVISRNVDIGQTVAASMQAPTLFVLAADLTKMQVVANLDESDVGRIRPGQTVSFRVDAYPAEDFSGTVAQVRLQPIVQQNVVTYATVIDVPNPQLELKPGMTANVNIEIARRSNVIRVPNAALRFRPTNEIFAALGQTPPEAPAREFGPTPAQAEHLTATPPAAPQPAVKQAPVVRPPAAQPPAAEAPAPQTGQRRGGRGFGAGGDASADPGERRGAMMERLEGLPPEQRERMLERMRARGFEPTAADASPAPAAAAPGRLARGGRGAGPAPSLSASNPQATTIDALFGPLPTIETFGRVWLYVDNQLTPVRVRLGITDGQATELIEGDLQPGTELVTNVATGSEPTRATPQAFPFGGGNQRFNVPAPGGGNRGGGAGGGNRGGGGGD